MVAQKGEDAVTGGVSRAAQGDDAVGSGVIAGVGATGLPFVEAVKIDGGQCLARACRRIDGSYGAVAVCVVDEFTDEGAALLDRCQPILIVEVHSVGCAGDGATGLVAVGVIAVAVAVGGRDGVGLRNKKTGQSIESTDPFLVRRRRESPPHVYTIGHDISQTSIARHWQAFAGYDSALDAEPG